MMACCRQYIDCSRCTPTRKSSENGPRIVDKVSTEKNNYDVCASVFMTRDKFVMACWAIILLQKVS
jgi:hypothetical protein